MFGKNKSKSIAILENELLTKIEEQTVEINQLKKKLAQSDSISQQNEISELKERLDKYDGATEQKIKSKSSIFTLVGIIIPLIIASLIALFNALIDKQITLKLNQFSDKSAKTYLIADNIAEQMQENTILNQEQITAITRIADAIEKKLANKKALGYSYKLSASEWYIYAIYQKTQIEDYKTALIAIKNAIQQAPYESAYYNYKALMLMNMAKPDDKNDPLLKKALAAAEKAIELDESHSPAWNTKGIILARQHEHKKAFEAYDKAITYKTNDISTYLFNKRISHNQINKSDLNLKQHIKYFEQQNQLEPNNRYTLTSLGQYHIELGCDNYNKINKANTCKKPAGISRELAFHRAIDYFYQALNLPLENSADAPIALNGLGIALHSIGKFEQALKHHNEAYSYDNNNHYTLFGLVTNYKELVVLDQNKTQNCNEAKKLVQALCDLAPNKFQKNESRLLISNLSADTACGFTKWYDSNFIKDITVKRSCQVD